LAAATHSSSGSSGYFITQPIDTVQQPQINMKTNYNTTITGEKCILVPYRQEHVDTYHQWMQVLAMPR
jgi:hypothetical protein